MSTQDPTSSPSKKSSKTTKKSSKNEAPESSNPDKNTLENNLSSLFDRFSDATSSAFKFAKKTGGTSYKVGKALIQSQDQLKLMLNAGQSLKDLREVAGLTATELSEAINLKDKSIIEAVENGTATLSFELILRLAALLARNDPIPFILKYSRTYSPETWRILNDWGVGKLPLHYERERQFINIYRSQDKARELSDEGFNRVLEFTRQAFNLSLHFIGEQEDVIQDMLEVQEEQLKSLKSKISYTKSRNKKDQNIKSNRDVQTSNVNDSKDINSSKDDKQ
ncbi:MAG: transcriptional regulator with XRE-family HTH domain [Oleiphilaceae bacterium]|jgi:transcriptional regulator with XRE-family HTH domain